MLSNREIVTVEAITLITTTFFASFGCLTWRLKKIGEG